MAENRALIRLPSHLADLLELRALARDHGRFPWELDLAPHDALKLELELRRLEATYMRHPRPAAT